MVETNKPINKPILNIIWLTVLAAVFRIPYLGEQSLWFDEVYTVFIAGMPAADSMMFLITDGVHPPLFYWLERLIVYFSTSETSVRMLAAIFGVAAIPALYIFGMRWIGNKSAIIAAILLAVSPFHIWYSQEARMYSAIALLAILCFGFYELFLNRDRKLYQLLFVVISSISYLIHYFTLLIPLVQFFHLVLYIKRYPRKIRRWTILQMIAAIPLIWWIIVIASREGNNFGIGWIPMPKPIDLLYTLMNFSVGFNTPIMAWRWVGFAITIGLILVGAWFPWRKTTMKPLTVIWATVPLVFIYLISLKRPTYVDRFLIISIPAFLLLVSCGIVYVGKRWSVYLTILVVGFFVWGWYSLNFGINKIEKENWREAVSYIADNIQPNEIIILRELQIAIPLNYYSNNLPYRALQINRDVYSLNDTTQDYDGV